VEAMKRLGRGRPRKSPNGAINHLTEDAAAKKAGFGGRSEYQRARNVAPELIEAMESQRRERSHQHGH
jgi:hypothetical protein